MSTEAAAVLVACITTVGSVAVAYITTRAHRETRRQLAENTGKTDQVLHQVQNDHGTNLRDDLDNLRRELHDKLERVEAAQGYLGGTVGRLIREVKDTLRHQQDHDAASALVVEQLRSRDEDLAAEIRRHHPEDKAD